jgi:A/G-specific adenine glycosylase
MPGPDERKIKEFQATVWRYYDAHGRHELPWRQPDADGQFNAYKIFISELMLQQTQVARVIPKYHAFIARHPSVESLARATLAQVLELWNGLGYNRRAKFVRLTAQQVMTEFGGVFPKARHDLEQLPGIGPNTAGAILAYAYNEPAVFIETNLRSVFMYHFFAEQQNVSDADITELITTTLNSEQPRLWYWALMDYGAFLKRSIGNMNRASKSYTKQSPFVGSRREVRGQIIRQLIAGPLTDEQLQVGISDQRLSEVLSELQKEGFIELEKSQYRLLAS